MHLRLRLSGEGFVRFASEPAVVDLDNNGQGAFLIYLPLIIKRC